MFDSSNPAWIVGAGSGIGRALALQLVANGYRVAASARSSEDLDNLAQETGGRVQAFPLDIRDRAAVGETLAAIENAMGPVGLAVLSAGTYARDEPVRFDADLVRRTVEVNLVGTSHCLEAVIAAMVARRSGKIAIVASVSGYAGLPGGGVYGATKSALITLAQSIRPELSEKGVSVCVINPGFVRTRLTEANDFPMPFMISAEDAAHRILRGLKGDRFEIAFPLPMVAGLKFLRLLPYPLFFWLTRRMLRKDRDQS